MNILWHIRFFFEFIAETFIDGFVLIAKWAFRTVKLVQKGVPVREAVKRVEQELNWELRAKRQGEWREINRKIEEGSILLDNLLSPDHFAWQLKNELDAAGYEFDFEELKALVGSEKMYSKAQTEKLVAYVDGLKKRSSQ